MESLSTGTLKTCRHALDQSPGGTSPLGRTNFMNGWLNESPQVMGLMAGGLGGLGEEASEVPKEQLMKKKRWSSTAERGRTSCTPGEMVKFVSTLGQLLLAVAAASETVTFA
jgi:hypothetical protein